VSDPGRLAERIEALHSLPAEALGEEARTAFETLRQGLESGDIRAAEPGPDGWVVNGWVKKGILLGFRLGKVVSFEDQGLFRFLDKDTFPPRRFGAGDQVRIVPGGSSVRSGAYLGPGVVVMPPAYVNVGAYVGEGSMIVSHALVGSCAQVGRRVHLSAGAMLGGVLEPVGALPVIVEDDDML
jgi:2,3,4,5-tetrahydropyridine-2-carboxylate N-succinyltransferase